MKSSGDTVRNADAPSAGRSAQACSYLVADMSVIGAAAVTRTREKYFCRATL
jgi:hypothetical protein